MIFFSPLHYTLLWATTHLPIEDVDSSDRRPRPWAWARARWTFLDCYTNNGRVITPLQMYTAVIAPRTVNPLDFPGLLQFSRLNNPLLFIATSMGVYSPCYKLWNTSSSLLKLPLGSKETTLLFPHCIYSRPPIWVLFHPAINCEIPLALPVCSHIVYGVFY